MSEFKDWCLEQDYSPCAIDAWNFQQEKIEKLKKRNELLFGISIDKNSIVIKKQQIISAALIMIKTMHKQPIGYAEILGWLNDYTINKENEDELIDAYIIVNCRKNYSKNQEKVNHE